MGNNWTKEQRDAIETGGCDLLVSAAAGSGKTAVLVERIITRILEKGQEIDRLLVVTFTKAAASEMSQRIGEALSAQLEQTPNDLHLQNQMAFLPRADIKTIHAFCLQVIREYYHILEIDPAVRTADPAEGKLLQKEVLEDLFEELYAQEENQWFFTLLETFGQSTRDDRLKELVLQTYTFAQGHPCPEALLECMAEQFYLEEGETVDACPWLPLIREGISSLLEYGLYQLRRAAEAVDVGFEAYAERLAAEREGLENLQAILKTGGYREWHTAFAAVEFARLPAYRGKDKERAERIKGFRNDAKDAWKKLGEIYFGYGVEKQTDLIRALYPIAQGLVRLTKAFMERFAEAKREKLMIDFHDYEHFCLKVLTEPESTAEHIIPTAVARELQQRYDEVMIDEYQDSNLVQEMILAAVSGESVGRNNRFMVGDVKQSIYRFRQAMPELFNAKYMEYPLVSGGATQKIVLSKNFRSRKNILDGANFLFRQLMQGKFGDIEYDDQAALYAGADFPDLEGEGFCGGANEILLVETVEQEDSELPEELAELDRRRLEAAAIAQRIRELMTSGYQVLDKRTRAYRPVAYGDVAVLFRSMKNWGAVLDDAFGQEGIPYYAETAEGYFDVPEVETALNLLRLIDNPRQDIPLLSILHSPIYGWTAEELVQLRIFERKGLYYDCMAAYLQGGEEEALQRRIRTFFSDLEGWRRQAGNLSLQELLRSLYRETGYYDYLGMTAGGALRQANLRLLLDKAEQYEKGSRRGLFYFIRYVEDMKTAEAETASAKQGSEGENMVRVMTIHKSKGLEFPVVFVSDMGKTFNDLDARQPVIFHQKWGCGMDYTDLEHRAVYRTLSKTALAEATRMENLSEEMRVLYVALTRAKEKLILTGAVKDLKKSLEKWAETADSPGERLPVFHLRRGKTYLDWVMPALLRHPQGEALPAPWEPAYRGRPCSFQGEPSLWQMSFCTREMVLAGISREQKQAEEQKNFFEEWVGTGEEKDLKERVASVFGWIYPFLGETLLPAKMSISEIKRKHQEEMTGELLSHSRELCIPKKQEKKGLTAAQVGIAMHTFLEEADLRKNYTAAELDALAEELVQRQRLTEEEAASLRKKELYTFFSSPLAQRLRNSIEIQKERPFSLLMEPKELFSGEEYAEMQDKILLNGIIDCYFLEEDGVVLLDYKSDRIYDESELKKRYEIQLGLYRTALERALGLSVKESYLYSFALGRAVAL